MCNRSLDNTQGCPLALRANLFPPYRRHWNRVPLPRPLSGLCEGIASFGARDRDKCIFPSKIYRSYYWPSKSIRLVCASLTHIFKAVAGMVFDRRLSHALPIGYQIQGSSSINWRLLSLIEPLSLRNEVLGAVALAIQVGFCAAPLILN